MGSCRILRKLPTPHSMPLHHHMAVVVLVEAMVVLVEVEKVALHHLLHCYQHHCIQYRSWKRKTGCRWELPGVLCKSTCTKSHGHHRCNLLHQSHNLPSTCLIVTLAALCLDLQ